MSVRQGNKVIAGHINYHPDLFDHKWADHLLNDVSWLRADTFSWQDGGVYEAAYNHLAYDISGKSLSSETIAGVTVQFYLADDGHKICPASEESNVASIYSATGAAWYYIIDTINERFKLPRNKHEHYGDRPVVGNGTSLGLTNGSSFAATVSQSGGGNSGCINLNATNYGSAVGTGGGVTGAFADGKTVGVTTDETKSGLISTPVADTDQYKYLYFYVGNFTQTALENTAGLNASLFNNKADIDASNFDATGKSTIAGFAMPSGTTASLTAGADGTEYTASANGWFVVGGSASSSLSMVGFNEATYNWITNGSGNGMKAIMPVRKGAKVHARWINVNNKYISFVYAQGEA